MKASIEVDLSRTLRRGGGMFFGLRVCFPSEISISTENLITSHVSVSFGVGFAQVVFDVYYSHRVRR